MWTEFEWENRVNVSTTMSYAIFTYRVPFTHLAYISLLVNRANT